MSYQLSRIYIFNRIAMRTIFKLFILAAALLTSHVLYAQNSFRSVDGQSKVIVKGTSSVHDWEMQSSDISVKMGLSASGQALQIRDVSFSSTANSLKSKHDLMNNKAYEALNAKKHPEIRFVQTSVSVESFQNNSFKGKLQGNLEIAGVTKNVEIPFTGALKSDHQVVVNGTLKLRMSDFGIKPPTAMMGTIKTGNEISLEYQVEMKSEKSLSAL